MNGSKVVTIFREKITFLHKILSEKEQNNKEGDVVGMSRLRGISARRLKNILQFS